MEFGQDHNLKTFSCLILRHVLLWFMWTNPIGHRTFP